MVTGGGGISVLYPLPPWQKSQVRGYFAKVDGTRKKPYPGYSKSGRGYPDISAAGTHFLIVIGGSIYNVGGTSVSAPIVAGMISLVNAARFRAGGKPVGFLNPVLYANSSLFVNDITVGKNNCTRTTSCCGQGFSAAPGWDPATGLGTLDFLRFKRFMMGIKPTSAPTRRPTLKPTRRPSSMPSVEATSAPSSALSPEPTSAPSPEPTSAPSPEPTSAPSTTPSATPSSRPSPAPSSAPSPEPTSVPSPAPSTIPSTTPSSRPSSAPSAVPSSKPVPRPTVRPSYHRPPALLYRPTPRPANTKVPSAKPTSKPSDLKPLLP